MSQTAIREAIEARIEALLPTLSMAWENANYKPALGVGFGRGHLMPARTLNPTMTGNGANDLKRKIGLYQISLNFPVNTGPVAIETKADAVVAHFPRGLSLTSSGVTVRIMQTPWPSPGFTDGSWFVVPVSIPYQADIF